MRSAGENSIQAASPGTGAQKGHLLCMNSLSNPRNLLPVPSLPFYKQPGAEEAKILIRKCLWRENSRRLLQKGYCLLLLACRPFSGERLQSRPITGMCLLPPCRFISKAQEIPIILAKQHVYISGVQGVVFVEIPLERFPIERFSLERMLIFRALYQIVTNHCHAHLDQSDLP